MALPTLNNPTYTLTLPSTGEKIKYRPFLVKEEKILLMATESNDPKDMVRSLKQIAENCTMGKFNPEEYPMFDLEYVFLNLRAKSVGEVAEPVFTPADCDKPVTLHVDLSKVEVVKAENHTNKVKLTDTIGLIMNYPSLDQAEEIDPKVGVDDPDFALEVIVNCIDSIYDGEQMFSGKDHTKRELIDFVENLTQEQFLKISEFFETMPKIRYTTKYKCPCSGEEKEITLSGLQDFFGSPSATTV